MLFLLALVLLLLWMVHLDGVRGANEKTRHDKIWCDTEAIDLQTGGERVSGMEAGVRERESPSVTYRLSADRRIRQAAHSYDLVPEIASLSAQ